jgi:hypothetical protein
MVVICGRVTEGYTLDENVLVLAMYEYVQFKLLNTDKNCYHRVNMTI